ncbi:RNA polymerase sigma factor [bacterium]|nr:RNA polymerase sigma factor [bacterium]
MDTQTQEDLVHETLTVIHSKYKTMTFEKGILPWAYGILERKLKGHWRKMASRQELEDAHKETIQKLHIHEEPADILCEKRELVEVVRNALGRLSPSEREILGLKFQGFSGEEIQNRLGLKRSAMDVRVYRATQKLKKILIQEGVTSYEMQ